MLDSLFVLSRGQSDAAQYSRKVEIIRALQRFTVCENAYGNGRTTGKKTDDCGILRTPDAKSRRRLHAPIGRITGEIGRATTV